MYGILVVIQLASIIGKVRRATGNEVFINVGYLTLPSLAYFGFV